jgi:hypothetical protein
MTSLEDRINELPPNLRRRVEVFVDSLLAKQKGQESRPLKFEWSASLSDLKERYTSVELQHEIARWRSGGE